MHFLSPLGTHLVPSASRPVATGPSRQPQLPEILEILARIEAARQRRLDLILAANI